MNRLSFSIILLSVIMILVFIGAAQRVLDRMRLTDATAIVLLLLLIISHFLPNIALTSLLSVNLGVLVPIGIVIYLLVTTSPQERFRAGLISIVVAAILWLTDQLLPTLPGQIPYDLDPLYIPGLLAGLISYFATRSRRTAFISAILAIVLNDLAAVLTIWRQPYHSQIVLGGAGVFDALLISGVLAVLIAEGIGEIRERIHRGPARLTDAEDGETDE